MILGDGLTIYFAVCLALRLESIRLSRLRVFTRINGYFDGCPDMQFIDLCLHGHHGTVFGGRTNSAVPNLRGHGTGVVGDCDLYSE